MFYISFTVEGKPLGKDRPRFFNGHAVTTAKTRNYEARVYAAACAAMGDFDGVEKIKERPCEVEIVALYDIPKSYSKKKRLLCLEGHVTPNKPDADNIAKSILDGMNGVCFKDDVQVHTLTVKKQYTEDCPCVKVTVWYELGEE